MKASAYSLDDIRRDANAVMQQRALMDAGRVGVAGLGAGFGLRSLLALVQQAGRNKQPTGTVQQPQFVSLYSQQPQMPEEEKLAAENPALSTLARFARGDYATTPSAIPWRTPALVGAGTAGLYGGYRLADWIADRYHQAELDRELQKERDAFQQALTGGAGSKLAEAIDTLYEIVKKSNLTDVLGSLAGYYGLYAGGSALLAGNAMYDKMKSKQRSSRVNKALKQRRMLLQQARPTPIFVTENTV